MQKILSKTITYFIISIITFLITTVIRYQSVALDLIVTHIIYFLLLVFFINLHHATPNKILAGFILGLLSILFIAFIVEGMSLVISLNIASYLIAMINGYLFCRYSQLYKKLILIAISTSYCLICEFVMVDLIIHYENHGNFTGTIDKELTKSLSYITQTNDTVNINEISDQLIVMEFWSTTCGVCFIKFPVFQKLFNKYKDNPKIIITSVNVPYERDSSSTAIDMIRARKYTFPVAKNYDGLNNALEIYAFPVSIIIRNNRVIYRGDLEGVEKKIENELEK